MAPFDWITPERVVKSWGIVGGLLLLGVGIGNVYLGLVVFDNFVLFGMNGYLLAGVSQIVAGIFFLIQEYKFRPRLPSQKSD